MKNQWTIWALVACVIVAILFIVNFQSRKEVASIGDIFPESDNASQEIEYEFVDTNQGTSQESAGQASQSTAPHAQTSLITITKSGVVPTIPQPIQSSGTTGQANQLSHPTIPFTIQVASFKDRAKADLALTGVKAAGYPAYLVEADLKEKGTWYRIYVGNFASKSQANEFLSQLKPTYKDSFVVSPK